MQSQKILDYNDPKRAEAQLAAFKNAPMTSLSPPTPLARQSAQMRLPPPPPRLLPQRQNPKKISQENQEKIIRILKEKDTLLRCFENLKLNTFFHEDNIRFLPSYKFSTSNYGIKYDLFKQKKGKDEARFPGYADRILFCNSGNFNKHAITYYGVKYIEFSDHMPVMCKYGDIFFITYNIGGKNLTSAILEQILEPCLEDSTHHIIINFQECSRTMTKSNLEKMCQDVKIAPLIAPFKLNYVSLREGSSVLDYGLITAHFNIGQPLDSDKMTGGAKDVDDNIDFSHLVTSDTAFNTNYTRVVPKLVGPKVVPIPKSATKGAAICRISLEDLGGRTRTIDVVNIHLPFGEINLDEYGDYLKDLKDGLSGRYIIINKKIELPKKIIQIEEELKTAKGEYESLQKIEKDRQSDFQEQQMMSPEEVKVAEEAVDTKKKKIAELEERLRDLREENETISSIHKNSEKPPDLTVVMGDFNSRSTCLLSEDKNGEIIDFISPVSDADLTDAVLRYAVITKKSRLINRADITIKNYGGGSENYQHIENYKLLLDKMLPRAAFKRAASANSLSVTQPPPDEGEERITN